MNSEPAKLNKLRLLCRFLPVIGAFLLTFTIKQYAYAGAVTLGSSTGVAGQEISISGTSFDASSTFCLTFDGSIISVTAVSQTTTGAGAFPSSGNASFVVPSGAFGTHLIKAFTISGGTCAAPSATPTNFALSTFTINTSTLAVTSPTVPSTGISIGVPITITGTNFEASTDVTILFDGASISTTPSTVTTSKTGAFDATITVPDVYNTGTHLIRASNSNYAVASTTLVVATPSITLNPSTAVSGMQVSIVGTNFKAGANVSFLLNNNSLSSTPSTVTSNGSGSFSAVFVVPDLIQGSATVKAYNTLSSTELFAVATLTVSTPALTLSPATASPGMLVNITGTNFKAGSTISLYLNNEVLTLSNGSTSITSNAQGGFTTNFELPDQISTSLYTSSNFQMGNSTVRAEGYAGQLATANLTVPTTSLTVTPTSGARGVSVFLTGLGFKANEEVTIYINGKEVDGSEVTTSDHGAFSTSVKIPKNLPSGAQTIRAENSSVTFANTTYTVTAAAVTASPSSGSQGSTVTLTGTNFSPTQTVALKWNGTEIKAKEGTVKSSNAGSFLATIEIPTTHAAGTNQIEVSTNDDVVLVSFAVSTPAITLTPSSGTPGALVTVSGTGFEGDKRVSLKWDDTVVSSNPSKIMTTAIGGFYATFKIPDSARGTHFVHASAGDKVLNSSASFTINAPTLNSSLIGGPAGRIVTINGSGFNPESSVKMEWDSEHDLALSDTDLKTDESGAFVAEATIPSDAALGQHTIKVKTSDKVFQTLNFTVTDGNDVLGVSTEQSSHNYVPVILLVGGAKTGSKAILQGKFFPANTELKLIRKSFFRKILKEVKTDDQGNFEAEIKIPYIFPKILNLGAFSGDTSLASIAIPLSGITGLGLMKAFSGFVVTGLILGGINAFYRKKFGIDLIQKVKSIRHK